MGAGSVGPTLSTGAAGPLWPPPHDTSAIAQALKRTRRAFTTNQVSESRGIQQVAMAHPDGRRGQMGREGQALCPWEGVAANGSRRNSYGQYAHFIQLVGDNRQARSRSATGRMLR